MKKFSIFALFVFALTTPMMALAQPSGTYLPNGTSIFSLVGVGYRLLSAAPAILTAIATVILLYNIVRYLVIGGNPEEKQKALKAVGFSFLGLFFMFSIGSGLRILGASLGTTVGDKIGGDAGQYTTKVYLPQL
jgi:hypothetical protein